MENPISYIFAWSYLIFGKFLGTIINFLILILIIYVVDKIILRMMKERYFGRTEPRFPKAHISYWIDKYIFKK